MYFRFALSFRDVEEMLAMRGIALSYETVREWCLKFGQTYANGLRRKSGDRWHLDEVFLKINGRLHYLWRAVDQDGDVLDILVQSRRDKKAAKTFFRKRRFKSAGHAQRFLSVFGIIASYFRPGRHLCTAGVYREMMTRRFAAWKEVVVVQAAP